MTKFTGAIPQSISIACEQEKYSNKLPEYKDIFGKKAEVELNLDAVSSFLLFDSTTLSLSTFVESAELCTYEGKYKAVLKLTDSVGFSSETDIEIFVTKESW